MAKHLQKKNKIDPDRLKGAAGRLQARLAEATESLKGAAQKSTAKHGGQARAIKDSAERFSEGLENFMNQPPERLEMINLPLISQTRKTDWLITILGVLILCGLMVLHRSGWFELVYLIPYLLESAAIYSVLVKGIRGKRFLPEFIAAILASLILLVLRREAAACFVIIALRTVMHAEGWSLQKCRDRAEWMHGMIPRAVRLVTPTGFISVRPQEIHMGETILCGAGEIIPLDGLLEEGTAQVDLAPLTGTEDIRTIAAGEKVLSGSRNIGGELRIRVTENFESSTASRICALAEDTSFVRSTEEAKIARITSVAMPSLFALALLVGVIVPVFNGKWAEQLTRAATILALSNLSALAISVFSGYCWSVSGLLQSGVQVRCSGCLSAVSRAESFAADYEAVLTETVPTVTEISPSGLKQDALLSLIATLGAASSLPEFRSLAKIGEVKPFSVTVTEEYSGLGMAAEINGKVVLLGTAMFLESRGIEVQENGSKYQEVHVADGEQYIGRVSLVKKPRKNLFEIIDELKLNGLTRTVLLTSEPVSAVRKLANRLGFERMKTDLDTKDRTAAVEAMENSKNPGSSVIYISAENDEALAAADIGIAFNYSKNMVDPETVDVLIYDDELRRLPMLVSTAKKTKQNCRVGIIAALAGKGLLLLLGLFGLFGVVPLVLADCVLAAALFVNAYQLFRAPELRDYESL